ncbi:MAG TPA: glucose-6-phosphate isomerase [Chthoniobacteraceae bacterium]|nr:glucose-6-phosphate isomerase [Chthoniobacteraceae bacterium]
MIVSSLWDRFQKHFLRYEDLGISLDVSRMRFTNDFLSKIQPRVETAFKKMGELEGGAIANPDENRMVGHYWLRAPQLAPDAGIRVEIENTGREIAVFAADVHAGKIAPEKGGKFTDVLVVGIGGSALGPQFVAEALGGTADKMAVHFLDNTDPDGFDKTFAKIKSALPRTLTVVISKSGGTKETRNGMVEAAAQYKAAGLDFGKHAVAVTGAGSELDKVASGANWLKRFPMWDWVGGRTSVMSAVGLVPAALQGLDVTQFLAGAAAMDAKTRANSVKQNASMLLALMWHFAGNGRGEKDMVILPYKDRLMLFSKYLQQLVMESLGKKLDLNGNVVHQGIAVYGNKGSTDQHAYVQQLRDGVPNFFATFIEVRKSRDGASMEVDPGVTSGDYLQGFLRGTRAALYEGGRDSITISIPEVNAFCVGALIALYERAVGFYATLVNINAYHQPGVEAGKKAATRIIELQLRVQRALEADRGNPKSAAEIAAAVEADPEDVYHVLTHMQANHNNLTRAAGADPSGDKFALN